MSAPSPVVKKAARQALSGKYIQSAVACCILVFTCLIGDILGSLIGMITGFVGVIAFWIVFFVAAVSPLSLGLIYYFKRLSQNQNDNVTVVFKYFSEKDCYKKALQFSALIFAKFVAAAAVLFFPCILSYIFSSEWLYALFDLHIPVWASNMWVLNSVLAIFAVFALFFVMIKYYLAAFLIVSDENMTPAEAVNMSTIISKRTGSSFVGLNLSFAWLILLSLLVAPLIFTLPYFLASYVSHCEFSVDEYNNDVDEFLSKYIPSFKVDEV